MTDLGVLGGDTSPLIWGGEPCRGRITPRQAFDATAKADPPRPAPRELRPVEGIPARLDQRPFAPRDEIRQLLIHDNGNVKVNLIQFHIDSRLAGQRVHVIETHETITFTSLDGTVLLEQPWPAPGITYVSNGRPRGKRRDTPPASPMS